MGFFDDTEFEPYEREEALFQELGLPMKWTGPETSLGIVELHDEDDEDSRVYAAVDIKVYCAPAKFYNFIVVNYDTGVKTEIQFGSGALDEYWPFVLLFAQSMVEVRPIPA